MRRGMACSPKFWIFFCIFSHSILERSWCQFCTVCGFIFVTFRGDVPNFLGLYDEVPFRMFFASFFVRFLIPLEGENRALAYTRCTFLNVGASYRKVVFEADFGSENAPKMEAERLENAFRNEFQI